MMSPKNSKELLLGFGSKRGIFSEEKMRRISWCLGVICSMWCFLIGCLLSGCSTDGHRQLDNRIKESLEVEILTNGSKMFTYRLRWPEDQIPNHIQIARSTEDVKREFTRGGVSVGPRTYTKLRNNAAYVVKQAGYCREGFLELDQSVSQYHLWLRGECKEDATSDDEKTFGPKRVLTSQNWAVFSKVTPSK
jgi:hypothetical protein